MHCGQPVVTEYNKAHAHSIFDFISGPQPHFQMKARTLPCLSQTGESPAFIRFLIRQKQRAFETKGDVWEKAEICKSINFLYLTLSPRQTPNKALLKF